MKRRLTLAMTTFTASIITAVVPRRSHTQTPPRHKLALHAVGALTAVGPMTMRKRMPMRKRIHHSRTS